ncbi:MAG: D-glycero-beta-D-manno-heptose 1-phosphate adenylyltransferase [Candidatus Marinimicrobia bacterium]|jgi:rfaE bifunctional protein nucleotidyltransferase chain/domain|nr:D-glycero-beta-D-manno-heptose 1-phosphate adenylyltransferase [Candidatus Neomarinimicrobiota bacterium]|tara:strand:+ start:315 stop:779 length:465 start_codon:yes stop_codon:yes gene_type:complete
MSLLEINSISQQTIEWRKKDTNIVFTNGCFDLLHKGHLDLLSKASTYGDILIVGLNSDSSVRKIKGKERPIENEKIRSKNLLKLNYVNYVIIFDSETPQDLIKTIVPNVLVKGGDYNDTTIIGAKEVISNGGKVKIIPLTAGYSTSSIIKLQKR